MAKRTVNIGSTANDGTGDQLRTAFDKLNQNNDEIYGANFVTEDMLSDNIVGADELKVTGNGAVNQILTSNADGTFSWATGVTGDITEIIAGDGLTTPDGTAGDVTLNVVGGTGITVAADSVSLATTVQDEISANTLKTGITSAQAGEIADNTLKVGITTAQAGEIVVNNNKFTNANHTGDVEGSGQLTIKDDVVTAAKLDVSNAGADGQVLQYNADGTMTWVTGVTGDVTGVAAGFGLTGGGTGGDLTLAVGAGDGITVAADTVSLATTVAGDGLTLASGVLSVDTIETGDIADDAVDGTKLEQFADTLNAGTGGDILVSNGVDFIQATMSGDATIDDTGAITIANDAVTADKLADSINADILTGVNKVSFPGFGTAPGTSLEGDTALLQLGTSGTTALAGDTPLLALGTSGTTALAGNTDLLQVGTLVTEALAGNTRTITTQEITDIGINNGKFTNATHTGDVTGSGLLTLVDNKVITSKILDLNVTTAKLADDAVTTVKILNEAITHDKLSTRFTHQTAISALTGVVDYDCSEASSFKLSGDLTGAYTINLTNYKQGQVITVYPLKAQTVTLTAGTGTEVFNKLSEMDYDNTKSNILQIECVDDQAANPVFFYSVASFVNDATI